MTTPRLTDRLEIRLSAETRKLLESAARKADRRLSDYCRRVLVRAAKGER